MRLPVQSPNQIDTNPMDFGMSADMSAWDNLSPFQTYLADSFAKGAKNRGLLDQRMKRALMGETLEEQDQTDFQKKAAENAFQLAQEAADMDDAEYEDLKRQLKGMVAQRPQMPGMPKLQTPNAAALGVAGIGALLNPQFGAQIAATPFQEGLRQQEQGYQQSMLGYQDELAKRQEEMKFLESQMDDARADRQTRINAAIKLAELTESARQFQVTEDNKLAIAGMNNTTKAAANRTATLKAILAKVPAEARAEVIGAMGLGFDAEALQAMSELNEAEKNLKAKTEGVKLDNKYKDLTLNDRVRTATANADYAELRKVGQEFNNDVLEVRAKYADQKAQAEIKRLNGLADGANKAAANVSARPITSTSWFNAVSRYEGAADKNDALAKAYQAEADRYRGRAALIIGADPKEAEKMHKAAAALDAKAAIARANSDAAIETLNSLQEKFGGGFQQLSNPFGDGVELQGNIGQPPKKVPGKPTNQRTAPRNFSSGKSKAKVTITKID